MLRDVLERGIRGSRDPSQTAVPNSGLHGVGDDDIPRVTPGGVLTYGDNGHEVATLAFGRSQTDPPDQAFEVTADTIYDLASLTKPMATAACFMKLGIDLNKQAISLLPELRMRGAASITFAQLLGHTSGWPAHLDFYQRLLAGERLGRESAREALFAMVCGTPLEAEPGTRELYSDLGYIALGFAIERATGKRLDRAVKELVTEPLGMGDTFYIDLHAQESSDQVPRDRIAPTEVCPYRGLVHAAVHDDNAHAGGGVFGHAGLFASAPDVGRFARAMLELLAGQATAGFQPDVARHFADTVAMPGALHTLGWDRPSPPPALSHTGELWPRTSIGHLGFTGTALWLDPPRGRYVVLLTNRVHPSRDLLGIREFRCAVMDAVVRELDGVSD